MAEPLIKAPRVAEILQVSTSWVYKNLDVVPHIRLGKTIRFSEAAIERFVESTAPQATPEPAPEPVDDFRPVGGRGRRA